LVAFIYWGRRGFSRFVLEAAAATQEVGINAYFSVSKNNECFSEFRQLGDRLFAIETFNSAASALLGLRHIRELQRGLVAWLTERRVSLVVNLMPHVWTPFIGRALQANGIRYAAVMHDSRPHAGDPTGLIHRWLLTDAKQADTVVTLSGFVRNELIKSYGFQAERVRTVFLPDLTFPGARPGTGIKVKTRDARRPLRILYFGRLMRYKGLPLFLDAMDILAAGNVPIEISVCGEGNLAGSAERLAKLGAVVINKWLSDAEIGQLMASHDAIVLTHTEASQSGVISAALGAGLPVVTTPVGALQEQVQSRGVGLVASGVDARSVADCVRRLTLDHALYARLSARIGLSPSFSMAHFLRELLASVDPGHNAVGFTTEPANEIANPVAAA